MRKIAVCVKQVPAREISVDPETGNLVRSGALGCMNVYDYAPLEMALRMKDKHPEITIHLITMGPPQAEEILREGLAYGGDIASLLSDVAFAGADALATSYTLSQGVIALGGFDLIFCGKQSTDGDTAQVAGALAAQLNLPYYPGVEEISWENDRIFLTFHQDGTQYRGTTPYPAVLSVAPTLSNVRMPTLAGRRKSKKETILRYGVGEISADPQRVGRKGSPTQVANLTTVKPQAATAPLSLSAAQALEQIRKQGDLWNP